MDDTDFLKRDIEAAEQARKKAKPFKIGGVVLAIVVACFVVGIVHNKLGDKEKNSNTASIVTPALKDNTKNNVSSNSVPSTTTANTTATPSGSLAAPKPTVSNSSYAAMLEAQNARDRRAWVDDARAAATKISQITDLLAFNPGDSKSTRDDKIKQAEKAEAEAMHLLFVIEIPKGNPGAQERALKQQAAQTGHAARAEGFSAILEAKAESNRSETYKQPYVVTPELTSLINKVRYHRSIFLQQIIEVQAIL